MWDKAFRCLKIRIMAINEHDSNIHSEYDVFGSVNSASCMLAKTYTGAALIMNYTFDNVLSCGPFFIILYVQSFQRIFFHDLCVCLCFRQSIWSLSYTLNICVWRQDLKETPSPWRHVTHPAPIRNGISHTTMHSEPRRRTSSFFFISLFFRMKMLRYIVFKWSMDSCMQRRFIILSLV